MNVDCLPLLVLVLYTFIFFETLYITIHVTFISGTLTAIVYHLSSNFRAVIFPVLSTGRGRILKIQKEGAEFPPPPSPLPNLPSNENFTFQDIRHCERIPDAK